MQPDSTQNIARRYRHLFTLPSFGLAVFYSSIPVIAIVALSRYVLHTQSAYFALFLILAEVFLLLGIEIDLLALKGRSKVATFRRMSAIAIMANSLWLVVTLVGYAVYFITGSESRFLSLVILGAFFAVSFRSLVFGSVFYARPSSGIPLAFIQPALILVPIMFGASSSLTSYIPSVICGLVVLVAVSIYLHAVNGSKEASKDFRPLQLLQAFLNAWVVEDATTIERLLDLVSKENEVRSDVLSVGDEKGSVEIIVPGVHPGPFYPIGSSNLPADIFKMRHSTALLPLTVHSISDHDLNLPSKKQVENYVSMFGKGLLADSGSSMSAPIVKKKNKATITGLAFGSTALVIITQAPHGMEDFPTSARDEILGRSKDAGFAETLIIDAHNSEGAKPSPEEAADAVSAASDLLHELKISKQYKFGVGFAHSSETSLELSGRDLGPAGIGLVVFELEDGERFSLSIVDANNAIIGFRESVIEKFVGPKLIELCTSDTHVTAARTLGEKGYITLGDETSPAKFADLLNALWKEAEKKTSAGSFTSTIIKSSVKTIGGKLLDDFSSLLDATTMIARRGAVMLGLLALGTIALVALL